MRKNTKIILIVLVILIILILGLGRKRPGEMTNFGLSPTPTAGYSEWAIPSLRNRSYDSEIKIERVVEKNSIFTSSIISYVSDGLKLYALMNWPADSATQNLAGKPVIILNHGHITPSEYSTVNSYKALSEYYPRQGFVMIKPDYRGHGDSEGGAESLINRIGYAIDVLNLLAGVEKLPNIDKNRIYMWGHSMGGEVTLRVLEVTDKVKAAVIWAPAVREWPENALYFSRRNNLERAELLKQEYEQLFGNGKQVRVGTLETENLKLVKIPVLIQHATGDASVPYEWGGHVTTEMQKAGIVTEFITYQGDDHNIVQNREEAQKRDIDWYNYSN